MLGPQRPSPDFSSRVVRAGLGLLFSWWIWTAPEAAAAEKAAADLIPVLTPKGAKILVEVADTTEERARGLMFQESLPPDRGMLFTFSDAQQWTFWMKNTRISLDIIWMDRNKKIVHVESNVPTCSRQDDGCPQYQPNDDALYVLEVAAGQAKALGLQRGVKLQFDVGPAGLPHPFSETSPRR